MKHYHRIRLFFRLIGREWEPIGSGRLSIMDAWKTSGGVMALKELVEHESEGE